MTDNKILPSRRAFTGGIALVAMSAALPVFAQQEPKITIYKNPSCDCCQKWAEHLAAAGFATELINRGGITALKTEWGVPAALHSCHTGKIDGYVIEGHVPAVAIKRLLSERPQAIGLAVPGMPRRAACCSSTPRTRPRASSGPATRSTCHCCSSPTCPAS